MHRIIMTLPDSCERRSINHKAINKENVSVYPGSCDSKQTLGFIVSPQTQTQYGQTAIGSDESHDKI